MGLIVRKPQPHHAKLALKIGGITIQQVALMFDKSYGTTWSWLNGYSKPPQEIDEALTMLAIQCLENGN